MADINIHKKFSKFDKTWTRHIIGELNEQYVKLRKLKDEFIWHSHKHEDELFMVFKGTLFMDFKDQETVEIKEGEIIIIPKGIEHRPRTNGNLVSTCYSSQKKQNIQALRIVPKPFIPWSGFIIQLCTTL